MPATPTDAAVCSAVEITGCFYPSPEPTPALVFHFTHEDGTELPPMVFVFDEIMAPSIDRVVEQQTTRAVLAARRVRGLS